MTFLFLVILCVFLFTGYSSLSSRIKSLEDALEKGSDQEPVILNSKVVTPNPIPEQPKPASEATIKPIQTPQKKTPQGGDLEQRLGGKIFTTVGVIAVLFGVGFFLRYAFENNLISPILRVTLGFAGSILFLGLGEWLRKKYSTYGQTLMGLGLGVAYLTWYATLHFYHLISSPVAFLGMILVTAIGLFLALRLNSTPLAVFAQIGGFLTPSLVGGTDNLYFALFSYILILDIAILILAYLKSWRELTLVGIIGTAVTFIPWFLAFGSQTPWIYPFIFITLYFLLFSITGLLRYTMQKTNMDSTDLFILVINPALYAIGIYNIIPNNNNLLTGLWFGIIGIIYLAVTTLINGNTERDLRYRNTISVIATAFLGIAIPIAFNGVTVIVAWSILATALIAWGYIIRSQLLLVSAHIVSILPVLPMIDRIQSQQTGMTPWLNSTFLSSLCIIACLSISAWIHWSKQKEPRTLKLTDSETNLMLGIILVEAYLVTCFALAFELNRTAMNHVWAIGIIGIIALIGSWIGILLRSFALRVCTYITFSILVLSFMLFFTGAYITTLPFLDARTISGLMLITTIALSGILYQRSPLSKEEKMMIRKLFFVGTHLFGLYLVSTEISGWFNSKMYSLSQSAPSNSTQTMLSAKNACLSVVWTVYALALLVFGIMKKSTLARKFAMILFSITVAKAFLYDTASLDNLYRFISFMVLGVLLLFSGYLYHRFKDRIHKFVS